jgi:integrase
MLQSSEEVIGVPKRQRRGWGHIRRLPSRRAPGRGRYQASYIGRDNRRHNAPHTFADSICAERWLAEERRLRDSEDWTTPAQRDAQRWTAGETLSVYGKRWIAERNVKPRTRALYSSQFTLHVEPDLGDVQIRHVTSEWVRRWYAALGSEHPRRNSQVYGLLHSIMATAVKDGLVRANPCQIERAMNTTRKRDPVILDVPDVDKLAGNEKMPDRYRALVLLSAWCGLRWGEVIELRRRDVSTDAATLTVARAVTHHGECRIDTPKSGKARNVVIPPHIRPAVKHHLEAHVKPEDDALLFAPVRGGCHLNDKVFADSYFKPTLTAIEREGVRVHDLRHFAGTMTAQVGGTIAETMRRLGHSTYKASMTYQAAVDQRDHEIAAALSKLANGDQNDR